MKQHSQQETVFSFFGEIYLTGSLNIDLDLQNRFNNLEDVLN